MHIHRFYLEGFTGAPNKEIFLHDKENEALIHQLLHVFRLQVDSVIIVFNKEAGEWVAKVTEINKSKQVHLLLTQNTWTYETLSPVKNLTLYMSIIKNSNFDLVVEKAVELGVSKIVPVMTRYTVKSNLNYTRLNKIVVEATEQCGRIDPFEVSPIMNLEEAIEDALTNNQKTYFADISGMTKKYEASKETNIALFIGPEGGWEGEEKDLFVNKNIDPICLGAYVLRAETAAIAGVSKIMLDGLI